MESSKERKRSDGRGRVVLRGLVAKNNKRGLETSEKEIKRCCDVSVIALIFVPMTYQPNELNLA